MSKNRVSNHAIALLTVGGVRGIADTWMPSALREQLLAQVQREHFPRQRPEQQLSTIGSPHQRNIDPAISNTAMINAGNGDSGGDDNGSDGRKGGKRELSTSKRAAQNRAAQVCHSNPMLIVHVLVMGLTWCEDPWVTRAAY